RAAVRFDVAAMAFDYAVAHCQPQPYSACSLGGKERLKNMITHAAGHADPVVAEAYSRQTDHSFSHYLQPSTLRHRIQRVEYDVDKHFSKFRSRSGNGRDGLQVK